MLELLLICAALLLCLGLSFFFSGSETAIISVDKFRLRGRYAEGDASAGKLLGLLANTPRLLVMVLIGTNLANVLLALFFKLLIEHGWPQVADERAIGFIRWSELLDLLILTPILIIFAETLPKAIFRTHADRLIGPIRPIFVFLLAIMNPLVAVVERLARLALAPLSASHARVMRRLTRQDVIDLVAPEHGEHNDEESENEAEDEGEPLGQAMAIEARSETERLEVSVDERRMIHNIIQLQNTRAHEIMRPLVELVAVQLGRIDLGGFKQLAKETGYTRFPVYRDRIVNLIGYVDLYRVLREANGQSLLDDFVEHPHYVPETMRVDDLLQEFLSRRIKNAVVVDEYGGCSGWISREDMLEEIVGEFEDELDEPALSITETAQGDFLIEGRMEIDAVNDALGTDFSDEDWETLAGLILNEIGHFPRQGDSITIDGWRATIVEMDAVRIDQVCLERI